MFELKLILVQQYYRFYTRYSLRRMSLGTRYALRIVLHTVQQESLASIKFGKLALSKYWGDLNLAIWILSTIGAREMIYIGEFLIWQPLPNSPNRQIKNLAKVSRYMAVSAILTTYACN